MRIGQTSIIVFVSKLLASALGFVATIYFARLLGAEVLGIYATILALVSWLKITSTMGVGVAIRKRISEGSEIDRFFTAGVLTIGIPLVLIVIALLLFEGYVQAYIADFKHYSQMSVVWFLIGILAVQVGLSVVSNTLQGAHLVHLDGVLQPIKIGGRSIIQIVLVFFGFGLVGMLVGYGVGGLVVAVIGLSWVTVHFRQPNRRHIRSLFDYAKFSWFGSLKSRAFSNADILVLQAFVSSSLVGVYSVAWSISKFFNVFGAAINQSVFPEISSISATEDVDSASGIIEDAIAYSGFIIIPGLVGGLILGERILRIYGPEFEQGAQILGLLLLSILFHNYMRQFVSALNAIDRPDRSFIVNICFVAINVVLNIVLVSQIGWIGAAIASAASTGFGLVLSYVFLSRIVTLSLPIGQISRQLIAAVVMGGSVLGLSSVIEDTLYIDHNFLFVTCLVAGGAAIYLAILLIISKQVRRVLQDNFLPARWDLL